MVEYRLKHMCKHCKHAKGDHWQENNKCAVKDCPCQAYEPSEEDKAASRWQWKRFSCSITAAVLTSPLFFLFDALGKPGNGRAAWFCAMGILVAIKVRWELREHI
jgi:hypothetical protein